MFLASARRLKWPTTARGSKKTLNSRTWGLFGKFILAVNLSRKVCQEYFETL
jgi:hypothetical protein